MNLKSTIYLKLSSTDFSIPFCDCCYGTPTAAHTRAVGCFEPDEKSINHTGRNSTSME